MRPEEVLQPAVASAPDADVSLGGGGPRGPEAYPKPGGPEVARQLLKGRRRGYPRRNGAYGAHLEHGLGEGRFLRQSPQDDFEGRSELRGLHGPYLPLEAAGRRPASLRLCYGAPRGGAAEGGEQGLKGHVLVAAPGEGRRELDRPCRAGCDLACGLDREQRYPPRRLGAAGEEQARSALRPQRAARSSALETASVIPPSCGPAQAPTNP